MSDSKSRWKRCFFYVLPFIIVLIIGTLICIFKAPEQEGYDFVQRKQPVQIGRDYYVTVTLAELAQFKDGENNWDRINPLPDIYFKIFWRSQEVFSSAVKDNTFIAKWSNAEFDLKQLALAKTKVSLDDVVQAARINVADGESITIKFFDHDLVSSDDFAGEMTIPTKDLWVGDTEYTLQDSPLKRFQLRVADMEKGVDMLK